MKLSRRAFLGTTASAVAVSDLFPDRCAALAQRVKCRQTYPSLEEVVKDDKIEAIFVATHAPSLGSYKDWRKNNCPMWYPTHAAAAIASGKFIPTNAACFEVSYPLPR